MKKILLSFSLISSLGFAAKETLIPADLSRPWMKVEGGSILKIPNAAKEKFLVSDVGPLRSESKFEQANLQPLPACRGIGANSCLMTVKWPIGVAKGLESGKTVPLAARELVSKQIYPLPREKDNVTDFYFTVGSDQGSAPSIIEILTIRCTLGAKTPAAAKNLKDASLGEVMALLNRCYGIKAQMFAPRPIKK